MNEIEASNTDHPDYRSYVTNRMAQYEHGLNLILSSMLVDVDAAAVLSRHHKLSEDYIGLQENWRVIELTPELRENLQSAPVASEITDLFMVTAEIKGIKGWKETPSKPYKENLQALERIIDVSEKQLNGGIDSEGEQMIMQLFYRLFIQIEDVAYFKELWELQNISNEINRQINEIVYENSGGTFADIQKLEAQKAEIKKRRDEWLNKYRAEQY